MTEHHLRSPLRDSDVEKLRIGDVVYLSGNAFTCRSRLQKYVFDDGGELPFGTEGRNILIHVGPIVIRQDSGWKLISFMPTSSIRFEKWGAKSVEQWDLKLICGKTTMGEDTMSMMKEKKCVHVSPTSVSPNLWINSIEIEEVHLYDELGSIEASWLLKLHNMGPFVVDIDCHGNNLYKELHEQVEMRRDQAYKALNIPQDFKYTKLY